MSLNDVLKNQAFLVELANANSKKQFYDILDSGLSTWTTSKRRLQLLVNIIINSEWIINKPTAAIQRVQRWFLQKGDEKLSEFDVFNYIVDQRIRIQDIIRRVLHELMDHLFMACCEQP